MQKHRWFYGLMVVLLLVGMLSSACGQPATPTEKPAEAEQPAAPTEEAVAPAPRSDVELVFVWHSGGLGEKFEELAKEYTALTGVKVRADLVPYGPQWHDKIAAEFAARGSGFDLAMFDSQSMSEFASGGHVVKLNDYLAKSTMIRASDFTPAALRQYGEYPEGSGDIFALPINQDCMGLVYRKDLFEDPKEMDAFLAKYGYDLAVPQTYLQLRDIAEFFTRPEQNLYGLASYGSRDYDAVTSPFDGVLWSFGGHFGTSRQRRPKASSTRASRLKRCSSTKTCLQYMPPGATGWFYDEVNNAVHTGIAAMAINWYYFFFVHADPAINPYADKMGYDVLPGMKDFRWQYQPRHFGWWTGSLDLELLEEQEEAWKFLEWFMTKDIQWKWVEIGAQTGRVDVLEDPTLHDHQAVERHLPRVDEVRPGLLALD